MNVYLMLGSTSCITKLFNTKGFLKLDINVSIKSYINCLWCNEWPEPLYKHLQLLCFNLIADNSVYVKYFIGFVKNEIDVKCVE